MGAYHVQPLLVRVDLGVIAMKDFSTFPKAPGLKPHIQMVENHIQDICSDEGAFYSTAVMQSVYSTNSADLFFILFIAETTL